MAPTVREKISNTFSGGGTSVTTGAGTQSGDTLVIFTGYNFFAASHMNAPTISGQTVSNPGTTADAGTDNPHMKLYTCTLTAGGAHTVNYTVTSDAESTLIVYVLIGNADIDGTPGTGASGTATASHTINETSPTSSDTLLLASVTRLAGNSADHWTAPSGMTDLFEELDVGFQASAQQTLSSSGATGSRTFTNPNSKTYAGILVALKAASGGEERRPSGLVVPSGAAMRSASW